MLKSELMQAQRVMVIVSYDWSNGLRQETRMAWVFFHSGEKHT